MSDSDSPHDFADAYARACNMLMSTPTPITDLVLQFASTLPALYRAVVFTDNAAAFQILIDQSAIDLQEGFRKPGPCILDDVDLLVLALSPNRLSAEFKVATLWLNIFFALKKNKHIHIVKKVSAAIMRSRHPAFIKQLTDHSGNADKIVLAIAMANTLGYLIDLENPSFAPETDESAWDAILQRNAPLMAQKLFQCLFNQHPESVDSPIPMPLVRLWHRSGRPLVPFGLVRVTEPNFLRWLRGSPNQMSQDLLIVMLSGWIRMIWARGAATDYDTHVLSLNSFLRRWSVARLCADFPVEFKLVCVDLLRLRLSLRRETDWVLGALIEACDAEGVLPVGLSSDAETLVSRYQRFSCVGLRGSWVTACVGLEAMHQGVLCVSKRTKV